MSQTTPEGYAGDVSVEDAFRGLSETPHAALVDVRTEPEWQFVGAPDLGALGREITYLSWQVYPTMQVDPKFAENLGAALLRQGVDENQPVYFLCRSGARSRSAAIALTKAGWRRCFNIADGFEGPLDPDRKRGRAGGWKAKGLPWRQS